MNISNLVRQHWAALRALLVLTVIAGLAYPLLVWAIGLLPGLNDKAQGSIISVGGRPVGSALIGQSFTDTIVAQVAGVRLMRAGSVRSTAHSAA